MITNYSPSCLQADALQLITMEKTAMNDGPRPTFEDGEMIDESGGEKIPGHYQFRDRVSLSLGSGTESH